VSNEHLTTEELAQHIKYDVRTIRERLKDSALLEGTHYIRPFGGRRILFVWQAIERDIDKASRAAPIATTLAHGEEQMFDEIALRYRLVSPVQGIKRLKLRRTDVNPFSLEEVQLLLKTIRRDYLLVCCFTGMRSGEVDGLQWKYIDFECRLILVRETRVLGEDEYARIDSSQREIQMSTPVYEALKRQEAAVRIRCVIRPRRFGSALEKIRNGLGSSALVF